MRSVRFLIEQFQQLGKQHTTAELNPVYENSDAGAGPGWPQRSSPDIHPLEPPALSTLLFPSLRTYRACSASSAPKIWQTIPWDALSVESAAYAPLPPPRQDDQ